MISIYTQHQQAEQWLQRYQGRSPLFACVLGFTETGLIPGISAAGAMPRDRQYTAIADAEFLINGVQANPRYPLPPLHVGASPVLISRAVVEAQAIPVQLINAGLPQAPAVAAIDVKGHPARCLSTGQAMDWAIVEHLFKQGLLWGNKLAAQVSDSYLVLGECVVGGTTTALAVLIALGIKACGKVNSSHPICNHAQKWNLVQQGLSALHPSSDPLTIVAAVGDPMHQVSNSYLILGECVAGGTTTALAVLTALGIKACGKVNSSHPICNHAQKWNLVQQGLRALHPSSDPLTIVAAVGDPMQIVVAGMAIAASRTCGVLLAGGTQMLAVYALARAIAQTHALPLDLEQIIIGTTRWVAEDPTGDTVGLAHDLGSVPLIATQLSFATSRHPQLQAYEQGYVKEGVGAGGCAIAAHLFKHWGQMELLAEIEALADRYQITNDQLKRGK